mgnify:FL=1
MSGDRSGSDAGSLRSGASGPAIDEASIADTERYDPVPPVALMIPVDPKMAADSFPDPHRAFPQQ